MGSKGRAERGRRPGAAGQSADSEGTIGNGHRPLRPAPPAATLAPEGAVAHRKHAERSLAASDRVARRAGPNRTMAAMISLLFLACPPADQDSASTIFDTGDTAERRETLTFEVWRTNTGDFVDYADNYVERALRRDGTIFEGEDGQREPYSFGIRAERFCVGEGPLCVVGDGLVAGEADSRFTWSELNGATAVAVQGWFGPLACGIGPAASPCTGNGEAIDALRDALPSSTEIGAVADEILLLDDSGSLVGYSSRGGVRRVMEDVVQLGTDSEFLTFTHALTSDGLLWRTLFAPFAPERIDSEVTVVGGPSLYVREGNQVRDWRGPLAPVNAVELPGTPTRLGGRSESGENYRGCAVVDGDLWCWNTPDFRHRGALGDLLEYVETQVVAQEG